MVTKIKTKKTASPKALGLVQVSLIPAQAEVERMVDYFKADMGFKDIRIHCKPRKTRLTTVLRPLY